MKAKRGVVIVKNDEIIATGFNRPLLEELCCMRADIKDNSQVERCTGIHAEQMGINNADPAYMHGATMYYAKVKEGVIVPSGKPSCTTCSRSILDSGIAEFVMWHGGNGFMSYGAHEFNVLSYLYFLRSGKG